MSLSRRELFLRYGLTAASLPFLPSLGNLAWAQQAPRKRFVTITIPHGIFSQHWLPYVPMGAAISSGDPGSLLRRPNQYLLNVPFTQRNGCKAIDLSPYNQALSPALSSKWQSVKSKVAFLRNLCASLDVGQGHTSTPQLGGYGLANEAIAGESIDAVIGRKLNGRIPLVLSTLDNVSEMQSLQLAGSCTMVKSGANTVVLPSFTDPTRVWDRLFSNIMGTTPMPQARPAPERRKALLERTLVNLNKIKSDERLSGHDGQRLNSHIAYLQDQSTAISNMTPPPVPTMGQPPPKLNIPNLSTAAVFNQNRGAVFKAQLRNAAGAIKLNIEQVVSISVSLENAWVSDSVAVTGSQGYHHSAGHLAAPSLGTIEEVRKLQQLYLDLMAEFLTELNEVEDSTTGKTYLDNTMVFITFEHSGVPNGHLRNNVPVILAGGFGTFSGGHLLDYATGDSDNHANAEGASHSRALFAMLNAFNITPAERSTLTIQGGQPKDYSRGGEVANWNIALSGLT